LEVGSWVLSTLTVQSGPRATAELRATVVGTARARDRRRWIRLTESSRKKMHLVKKKNVIRTLISEERTAARDETVCDRYVLRVTRAATGTSDPKTQEKLQFWRLTVLFLGLAYPHSKPRRSLNRMFG
jgi:hypothetical protein